MSLKTATLAGQLQHFAQSVDIVDDTTFEAIRRLVYKYVANELKAEYFELMQQQSSDDGRQTWLKTFWSSQEKDHLWPIPLDRPHYNPVTQAFEAGSAIWLTDAEKKPLGEPERYQDRWSSLTGMTTYKPSDPPTRTLVAVPLYCRRRLGIYFIEIRDYIELTDVAKTELRRLADALAILFELYLVNQVQTRYTSEAIADLNQMLVSAKFPRLAKPHFFVAFPNRADSAVTGVIKDVLDSFSDQLEFTDWSEMSESGNISFQIGAEISRSRFGICYFSERAEDAAYQWDDNKNVVFEAGMLHERTRANAEQNQGEPTGWIPIREENSPAAPFDFSGERIIYVPRAQSGSLNEQRFRDALTKRIARLLDQA